MTLGKVDFERRPILAFWETTRACGLACMHCRASAIREPVPGELSTEEAEHLLQQLAEFGTPPPVLVATGGDVLMRADIDHLAALAQERRLPLALAPSVTPLLNADRIGALRRLGLRVASISLDGASAAVHDRVRGIEGHFEATLAAIRMLRAQQIVVQVNTLVMRDTVCDLPQIARIVQETGASIWEVFFLIQVGRGASQQALDATENEQVCHLLFDASHYGMVVRTVEAPFFRRVVAERMDGAEPTPGDLYHELHGRLVAELGTPQAAPRAQTKGTRDGSGIIFIAHDGTITPSGFLPLELGNVREDNLSSVYRHHPLLRKIRSAHFAGRCGSCRYRHICGGSRARAYAVTGDPLGEDPGCAYVPSRERPVTSRPAEPLRLDRAAEDALGR